MNTLYIYLLEECKCDLIILNQNRTYEGKTTRNPSSKLILLFKLNLNLFVCYWSGLKHQKCLNDVFI